LPGSRIDLARTGIGVAVRQGTALPDVATAQAVRKLLLAAGSITYPDSTAGGGTAGLQISAMLGKLGIASEIGPKATLLQAISGGVALVADGKAEIGLFNISEIVPVSGVALAGPLPAELQSYILFS